MAEKRSEVMIEVQVGCRVSCKPEDWKKGDGIWPTSKVSETFQTPAMLIRHWYYWGNCGVSEQNKFVRLLDAAVQTEPQAEPTEIETVATVHPAMQQLHDEMVAAGISGTPDDIAADAYHSQSAEAQAKIDAAISAGVELVNDPAADLQSSIEAQFVDANAYAASKAKQRNPDLDATETVAEKKARKNAERAAKAKAKRLADKANAEARRDAERDAADAKRNARTPLERATEIVAAFDAMGAELKMSMDPATAAEVEAARAFVADAQAEVA